MTVSGEPPVSRRIPAAAGPGRPPRPPAPEAVRRVCPYLVAEDGAWRSAEPTRDHRCGATAPPAMLAPAKQRDLCLLPVHATCATYRAARDLEAASVGGAAGDAGLWPTTRAAVLALEPPRSGRHGLRGARSPSGGQALLAILMVAAFAVLVLARTTPPSSGTAGASVAEGAVGLPSAAVATPARSIATPSPEGTRRPTASPAVPSPTTAPPDRSSAGPSGQPAGATTHTVKAGDTLSSIAAAYGVSVKRLKKANNLTDNIIRRGQVLVIPTT